MMRPAEAEEDKVDGMVFVHFVGLYACNGL